MWGLHPSAQTLSPALQGWVTAFQVQGYAHTGLRLIWEQQGDWVGGKWEWPGRTVMPWAGYRSLSLQKAEDDTKMELVDMPSCPGAGTGHHLRSLVTPPRPLSPVTIHSVSVIQETETTEDEPEGEKAGAGCMGYEGMGRC